MKLLLDQNLSRRILPSLFSYFPGSTHVALEKLETATDEKIWLFAKENNFVIVTKDSDFEELSIIKGTPPQIIWIKIGNADNKTVIDILTNNKDEIHNLLTHSEISCIELYQ